MNEQQKLEINSFNYKGLLHNNVGNEIYLNEFQKSILKQFDISYDNCLNVKELIYKIECVLDDTESEELENVLDDLAEFQYYNETKK